MAKRIWFNDNILPACLYTDLNDVSSDIDLIVTGWGTVSTERKLHCLNSAILKILYFVENRVHFCLGIERPAQLQKVQLKPIPSSECNLTFLQYNERARLSAFSNGINEGQFCAIDPRTTGTRADSCAGDSGGPLQMFPSNSKVATVVGVVSYGMGCGGRLPGVYTRVAHYVKWIESYVWLS